MARCEYATREEGFSPVEQYDHRREDQPTQQQLCSYRSSGHPCVQLVDRWDSLCVLQTTNNPAQTMQTMIISNAQEWPSTRPVVVCHEVIIPLPVVVIACSTLCV